MESATEEIPKQEEVIVEQEEISPEPIIEQESLPSNEVKAETVEITKEAEKRIIPHVEPRQIKINRFRFKNESDKSKLINIIKETIGNNITVKIDTNDNNLENKPDIILEDNGKVVGIINLLLCNHNDINVPEKHYIKLYFREFKDQELYNKIKGVLVNFFENFQHANNQTSPPSTGGNRKKRRVIRTHKRKHISKRKKTIRRR